MAVEPATAQPRKAESSHRRVALNVGANFVSFGAVLVVGLWYTPYLIRHLGVEVYGLIPLSNSIVSYLNLVGIAISGSVGRFIAADLARGDPEAASRTASTFFGIALAVITVVCPLGYVFSWFSPRIFNVPSGSEGGLRAIMFALILAFLLGLVSNIFDAALWAKSRFDIRAGVDLLGMIIRTSALVLLFTLIRPSLTFVAAAIVLGWVTSMFTTMKASSMVAPEVRVSLRLIDRRMISTLLNTGAWLLVIQAGSLLLIQMDLVLINLMLGPAAGGKYAPNLQWVTLLRTTALMVNSVLGPAFVNFYATGDHAGTSRVCRQSMKFLGLMAALIAGVLLGFAQPLLRVWLGKAFVDNAPIFWILLLPVVIEAAGLPLTSILFAQNQLRGIGISTLAAGLGSVALAVVLTKGLGWGVYGVAAASASMSLLRNLLLIPLSTAKATGQPVGPWVWRIAQMGFAALAVASVSLGLATVFQPASWVQLGLAVAGTALLSGAPMYFIVLGSDERKTVRTVIWHTLGRT